MNKKGMEEDMKRMILAITVLLILMLLAGMLLLRNTTNTGKKIQSCGGPMTGTGSCKEVCDPGELELEGVGCEEGINNICCISGDNNAKDTALPKPYGQTTSGYNFKVSEILFSDTAQLDSNCVSEGTSSVRCIAGSAISIPITISVKNNGAETIGVIATPVYVINDNPDKMETEQYRTEKPVDIIKGETGTIQTTITITSDQSILNDYWEIYPYVLCTTEGCQKLDLSSRGVYRGDKDNFLTIKFVESII